MIRTFKNTLAVLGATCFVIGMQGFAIGGFSGQASPDASKISTLGVDPLQNALFLLVGWGLVAAARKLALRHGR